MFLHPFCYCFYRNKDSGPVKLWDQEMLRRRAFPIHDPSSKVDVVKSVCRIKVCEIWIWKINLIAWRLSRIIVKQLQANFENISSEVIAQAVFLCRLPSIATHRDHFVRPSVCLSVCPSVCPSVTLSKAMFRRRHMHSSECCHYFCDRQIDKQSLIVF